MRDAIRAHTRDQQQALARRYPALREPLADIDRLPLAGPPEQREKLRRSLADGLSRAFAEAYLPEEIDYDTSSLGPAMLTSCSTNCSKPTTTGGVATGSGSRPAARHWWTRSPSSTRPPSRAQPRHRPRSGVSGGHLTRSPHIVVKQTKRNSHPGGRLVAEAQALLVPGGSPIRGSKVSARVA